MNSVHVLLQWIFQVHNGEVSLDVRSFDLLQSDFGKKVGEKGGNIDVVRLWESRNMVRPKLVVRNLLSMSSSSLLEANFQDQGRNFRNRDGVVPAEFGS